MRSGREPPHAPVARAPVPAASEEYVDGRSSHLSPPEGPTAHPVNDPGPLSTPTDTFRRRVTGLCLIGFPITHVATNLVLATSTTSADDPASILAEAESSAGALLAAKLLLLLSTALFLPASFGLLHVLRRRGAALGHVGVAFGVLGALGHAMLVLHTLVVRSMPGGDSAEMRALLERINEGATFKVAFPLLISFGLAILLLGIALRRAGVLPWWGLAAVVTAFLLISVPHLWVEAAQNTLVTIAFGYVGLRLLRMTDREWAAL